MCSVPVFFLISGYFYKQDTAAKQAKKIFRLMLIANIIYFVWKLFLSIANNELVFFLKSTFTFKNLIKFLIFNESHLQSHLWYLGAILYVTIIVTFICKLKYGKDFLFLAAPFLLIGDLIFGKYSIAIFHRELPYILVRNWLFVGLPYFTVGIWIKENQIKVKKNKLIIIIGISTMTSMMERWVLVSNQLNPRRADCISTIFLSLSLFLYFLHYVDPGHNFVSKIGREYSTWIYIFHPIIIFILEEIMIRIGIFDIYVYIRPIIVFLVTTLLIDMTAKLFMRIKSI